MPSSVMLVRWNGGWEEVVQQSAVTSFGRAELFLSVGAAQSPQEARRLAAAELKNQFAKVREQITGEHRPESRAKTPYVGYKPSDRITAPNFLGVPTVYQVQAMAVTETDEGELNFVPTLGDNVLGFDDLQNEIRTVYGWNPSRGRTAQPATGRGHLVEF